MDDFKRVEVFSERLMPLVRRNADATVALVQPDKNGFPRPRGSAVLLRIGEALFLLTASHVFDHADTHVGLAAIADEQFIPLPRSRWRTRPTARTGQQDPADLAIVPLGSTGVTSWPTKRFLSVRDVLIPTLAQENAADSGYLAIGFPDSKQPKRATDGSYATFAHHFLSHKEDIGPSRGLALVPELHLAIGYDVRGFTTEPGVSQMPKPTGMSGGGLWLIPDATHSRSPVSHLVAILTEYHKRERIIVSTRMWSPLLALREFDPPSWQVVAKELPELRDYAA